MDTFAVYETNGDCLGTVDAHSVEEATAKYIKLAGLKQLPKGWFIESIHA